MGLELFFRNLKYLFKYNLKGMYNHANPVYEDELILKILDTHKNLEELRSGVKLCNVMDAWSTLDYLISTNASFCRFGDGELSIAIEKQGNVFQRYDDLLSKKLMEVLSSKDNGLLVGINYYWFNAPNNLHDRQMLFYLTSSIKYRQMLKGILSDDRVYGDSTITMPYVLYKDIDFRCYYDKLESLWKGKDIVIVCGKTIFNNIKHNIFSSANSIEYIYGPSVNAFDQYDDLMQKILATDKNKVKFIIMGQTATVLAYDLYKNGHRAIDMGHTAKDYNYYLEKQAVDTNGITKFFDKD